MGNAGAGNAFQAHQWIRFAQRPSGWRHVRRRAMRPPWVAQETVSWGQYRQEMHDYLVSKPN
jgi:hypothetical protein